MTETQPTEKKPSPTRMVVLDGINAGIVARIALTANEDGTVQLSISGDDPNTQSVATAAQDAAASVPSTGEPVLERIAKLREEISVRLEIEGYDVKDLPEADISLSIEVDIKSGRLIGHHEALHEFATTDLALANDMHAALEKAFSQGPVDLAVKVQGYFTGVQRWQSKSINCTYDTTGGEFRNELRIL